MAQWRNATLRNDGWCVITYIWWQWWRVNAPWYRMWVPHVSWSSSSMCGMVCVSRGEGAVYFENVGTTASPLENIIGTAVRISTDPIKGVCMTRTSDDIWYGDTHGILMMIIVLSSLLSDHRLHITSIITFDGFIGEVPPLHTASRDIDHITGT